MCGFEPRVGTYGETDPEHIYLLSRILFYISVFSVGGVALEKIIIIDIKLNLVLVSQEVRKIHRERVSMVPFDV